VNTVRVYQEERRFEVTLFISGLFPSPPFHVTLNMSFKCILVFQLTQRQEQSREREREKERERERKREIERDREA